MKAKTKCSKPKCRRKATQQLLGKHPICRKCADERNRKSRARSKVARSEGRYSPSIKARWSEAKRKKMEGCNHDYENAIRTGRARYLCPKCYEDISFTMFLLWQVAGDLKDAYERIRKESQHGTTKTP